MASKLKGREAYDIFISYKNDGEGEVFAEKLCSNLKTRGYDVYFNPDEQHAGNFPDTLRNAVESCRDFLLILTRPCLEQLIRHDKVDWVREELLTAFKNGKNIIPLLMPNVAMPKDKDDMPEDLRFLPDKNAIMIPVLEYFSNTPLDRLLLWMESKPENNGKYRNSFNNNDDYNVTCDFIDTLQAAQSGDEKAMYEIGIMYYFGFSNEEGNDSSSNYREAAKWFKKTAHSPLFPYSALAKTMLAKMYFSGAMPREGQSFEKCFELYEEASRWDVYAKSKYDWMILKGLGCDFTYDALERLLDPENYLDPIAAAHAFGKRMDSRLFCDIATVYASYGRFDKAAEIYESLKSKNPEVEYQKGLLYKRGVYNLAPGAIPCPDYKEAERCFRNASEKNHLQATFELAELYFNPINKEAPDFEKAKALYEIAAKEGHTESQYKLGWIYEYGLVDEGKDYIKAVEYYESAASKGHGLASLQLAQLYQQAEVCNYEKAFKHAKASAESGCDIAEYILGNLYMFGRGTKADIDLAYRWYEAACKHGIFPARFMLDKINEME